MRKGSIRSRRSSQRKENSAGYIGDGAPGPLIKARGKEWGGLQEYRKKMEELTLIAYKFHSLGWFLLYS